jgi:hypothetical protein
MVNLHVMGGPGDVVRLPDELATGRAYRLRIQLFAN